MNESIQSTNGSSAHVRHAAPAHSRTPKGKGRNSSIELLRIIAMFMILMHHFIVHNGYDVLKLPLGPERIFFQLVMAGGGKVGVVIFFSISAWFFLDREQTIKFNLRRVWIMERELLFWSLILLASYLAFDRADLGMKLMVKSFVPLSMNVWWYATAYAIFLALLPFLSKGLKALGREYHLALATTVLVIWGLTSFIPGMVGISDGFFGFIYLFILISAYKWHLQPLSNKQTWILTLAGVGFVLLYTAASTVLGLFGINKGIFITGDWKLPVVTIGFGMFLLFDHQPDCAIRVRRIPHHRLHRLRETTLGPTVQPEEPLPIAVGNPADTRHPTGDLRGLHPARLHPPGTVHSHHRPPTRTLVRPTMGQSIRLEAQPSIPTASRCIQRSNTDE